MNKVQALQAFWESFGWPAIDEQSAYDAGTLEQLGISYPYITTETATSDFDSVIPLGADLWDRSPSWERVTKKALEIEQEIGLGGKLIPYDGGAIWITKRSPFSPRQSADAGFDVRRIHININAEFLSA